jgi:hypothetical protein
MMVLREAGRVEDRHVVIDIVWVEKGVSFRRPRVRQCCAAQLLSRRISDLLLVKPA